MKWLRWGVLGFALLSLAAAVGMLALWVVGVWVSDRFAWSQPVSFVPRQFLVVPAWAAWLVFAGAVGVYGWLRPRAEGIPWRAERRGRSRVARLLGRARLGVGVGVALVSVHLVVVEWRWPTNAGRAAPAEGQRLRVIHWNVGWSHPDEVLGSLEARRPDLAIVVNPMTRAELGWDFAGLGVRLGGEGRVIRDWPINVVSRCPIVRHGVTELGFTSPVAVEPGLRDEHGSAPIDPGHAMFVELNVGAPLNRTVVVWVVDLPSDPELHRPEMMRRARERIEGWVGPFGEGFPEPDVLIGDFNTPRGSWSLGILRERPGYAMGDAHAQGGVGASATYSAQRPLFHIDQCYLGPGLRAARYAVENGGATRHLMQVVDIVARP